MAKKGQKFRKWSFEEKLRIVKRHTEEHVSIRELGKQEGANNALISAWIQRYAIEGEDGLRPKPRRGNPYAALHTSKSLTELEELRLRVVKQDIEIARLKKGYWVEGEGADRIVITSGGVATKLSKNSK
jgi:transposase-like protein